MTTTYRLVLVAAPSWAAPTTATNDGASTPEEQWGLVLDHEATVTLGDDAGLVGIKGEQQEDSPADRARRLLEQLEQEGSDLEESFKHDYFSEDLAMFPDVAAPIMETDKEPLSMDLDDSEVLLDNLVSMLPESPALSDLSELDELLEMRAKEVLPDDTELQFPMTPSESGMSSPGQSSPSYYAPSTPSYAPSTPASSECSESSGTDPEWCPEPETRPAKTTRGRPPAGGRSRVRNLPINRAERKKIQNKNAATRYRNKKKEEEEELLQVEAKLIERNNKLRSKVMEAETEMRIVKDLLRSKFRRMGLLK